MDLNYLYHRHQVSLFMSEHAASEPARAAHLRLVEGYASRIDAEKQTQRSPETTEMLAVEAAGTGEIIA